MLKAKIAENCMSTVGVVILGVCRWCWSTLLVDGVDGELYLSWESGGFFTVLTRRLHRVHAFFGRPLLLTGAYRLVSKQELCHSFQA